MFTTWRSYIIHIQRDCCQASKLMTGRPAAAAPAPLEGPRLPTGLTINQFHVCTQPFWPVLRQLVTNQAWFDIGPEYEVGAHLSHNCMICGVWNNRYQEMHNHYRLHHSDMLPGGHSQGSSDHRPNRPGQPLHPLFGTVSADP